MKNRSRKLLRWSAVVATVSLPVGVAIPALAESEPIRAQVLAIADFHGALQPPAPQSGGEIVGDDGQKITVGGAAYLAAHVKQLREGQPNSILYSNGDNFAGAPFEADVHWDEPNVEVLNTLGVDFSNVGNHELDVSREFLVDHMADGECFGEAGKDSCFVDSTGQQFHGSDFEWSTGNVVDKAGGEPILPPYLIREVAGEDGAKAQVGFINLTNFGFEFGPSSYQPDLSSLDVVETANRYAAELKDKGVNAIVLNAAEGARPKGGHDAPYNGCDLESGPLIDIAARVSSDVDAIVGGDKHTRFNCQLPDPNGTPRPVLGPGRYGDVVAEIELAIDPDSGDVIRDQTTARNHANTRDVAPDPDMQRVVDHWKTLGQEWAAHPAAEVTGDFTKDKNDAGESTLGDLAADCNLWTANQDPATSADFGLVMTDPHEGSNALDYELKVAASGLPGDAEGRVTGGEAWAAYGYGDPYLTVTLTGAQIDAAFEQQWTDAKFAPLAVSANVSYGFDPSRPIGDRVAPEDFRIGDATLDPAKEYRVAVMSYTALGEDGIPALKDFTDPTRVQPPDHEAWVAFLKAHQTLTPAPLDRVKVLGS
ncbi:MAG: bifunctional metallophosphatase/5'-nucleotidase [Stackebrandtia sp.]